MKHPTHEALRRLRLYGMARGLEDTCFYIYNRFVSLNEVGGDPTHFGLSASDFHRQNQERNRCGAAEGQTESPANRFPIGRERLRVP